MEGKPESKIQQGALEESLKDAGAETDTELVDAARALLDAIKTYDPAAAETVGVDLTRIDASSIDIQRVRAREGSTGVRASDVTVEGALKISDIDAGAKADEHP